MSPLTVFQHDACPGCRYLGPWGTEGKPIDLWFCDQGGNLPTVIARYSDTPEDYSSGWTVQLPELVEARRRAHRRSDLV